ncbi:disease resistance protein RPV1-like [Macadamia integrifolia]|uniref:disease resistance protein RPV1-like n=1 Tax=Macadamia integrifolia TaxID=60698 RepID=UPI001C532B58|nr:disease resistance protein RPV1-like [Macadamia integrifolia]
MTFMEPQVGSLNCDVFINFRGEDTRNIFIGDLYTSLKAHGIHTFMDSKDLRQGEAIGELLNIIKGAKLSIAIFSRRYVESKWCLQELSQMVECHRTNGQIILPIFFKVEPSDVKNQSGCFQISSRRHSREETQTLSRWKEALQAVGSISGWVIDDRDDQSEVVEKVVKNAWIQLNKVPLIDVKNSVGLQSRIESVLFLLSNTSNTNSEDIQFLGICGQGGIGKTTIATAVYNCISKDFSKSCFLEDIREQASQPNGIVCLQEKLLQSISQMETKISSSKEGSSLIKDKLQNIKTLLILDDVNDRNQLNALAGDLNWFGPRSRIIITTRDRIILSGVPKNDRKIYEPRELNKEESLRLFSSHAFSMEQPPNDFMQLSIDIVHTTRGLPLALEVLGSELSMIEDEEAKEVWKSMLRILEQSPHKNVYEKLKISFDNLQDDIEKAMFLDVACLFIGWEEETVISIWEACGFEPKYRIEVLKRKSLLKFRELGTWVKKKYFWMHDQVRDMGRRIAYDQRPENPDNHSRLWSHHNIMKVLNSCKGNEMVEGLLLDFNTNDNTCLHAKDFEKMPKLRLLQIDGANLHGSFQCFPSRLRWLRWHSCPLETLPTNFYHEDLVMLDLSFGMFSEAWNHWHENKLFQRLKVLKLSHCCYLSKSPYFSGFPCLERLYLYYCDALVNLHESIGELQQLVYLNLGYCKSLEKLPNSVCRLRSLQNLILTDCKSLKELPKSIGDLKESLIELSLERTNIKALPDGVGLLKKLEVLNLYGNCALMYLPESMENMTSLRNFQLSGHDKLFCIPKLPSSLIMFHILYKIFESLPDMQNLKNLEELWLGGFCVKMEQFKGFVKTNNNEYSELMSEVDRRCMVTNHHSWQTKGQQGSFLWGNIESWRQIWIPLQQHNTDEEGSNYYLIPNYYDICSYRLIMHVSLSVHEELTKYYKQDIRLRFLSCVHSEDKKTDCELALAIEGLSKFTPGDHIEYIHEFKGFDWFGVQLEGRDSIEISDVIVNYTFWGKVSRVNLFLMKEGPMFDNQFSSCPYGEGPLEIVRYN